MSTGRTENAQSFLSSPDERRAHETEVGLLKLRQRIRFLSGWSDLPRSTRAHAPASS